jgi:hypothetical protein
VGHLGFILCFGFGPVQAQSFSGRLYKVAGRLGFREAENYVELLVPTCVYHPSGVGVLRRRLRRSSCYPLYCVMREGACYSSIVVLRGEARCSSSSCSLDSSIRREVLLHRRIARRIDVPPSSGYVYRSRDWEIYQIHWIRRCIVKYRANSFHHLGIRAPG